MARGGYTGPRGEGNVPAYVPPKKNSVRSALAATGAPTDPAVTPPPTVNQLAADAGTDAAPATPAGAASLGANPDQAKMVGTPNQQPAQLGLETGGPKPPPAAAPVGPGAKTGEGVRAAQPGTGGAAGQTDLAAADRASQLAKGQADAQQASDEARRQQLKQSFGDVGLGVDKMIQAALNQSRGGAAGLASGYSVAEDKLAALPGYAAATPQAKTDLVAAAQHLAENPNDPASIAGVEKALDAAGVSGVTPDQFAAQLLNQQSAEGRTASQVVNSITLDPETLSSFGISEADLGLLGLTKEQVAGMPIADFQTRIKESLQQQSQQAAGIAEKLKDPSLTPDVRKQLQDQLRATGAAGAYSSGQDVKQILDNQIANPGEKISIGGQDYSVEDVLDDGKLSGLLSQYLSAPEGSDVRTQLKKQFPDLAKFAEDNQKTLSEAAASLGSNASAVVKTQAGNQKILDNITQLGGVSATDAKKMLGDIFPNFGDKYSTDAMDLSKSGIAQMMADPSGILGAGNEGKLKGIVSDIQEMQKKYPGIGAELARITPDELKKLGVGGDDANWKVFKNSLEQSQVLNSGTPEEISQKFFGTSSLATALKQAQSAAITGDKTAQMNLGFLDADRDGKLDSPASIKQKMQEKLGAGSIKDLLAGKQSSQVYAANYGAPGLASKVKYADLLEDGKFTTGSVKKMGTDWKSMSDLLQLPDTGFAPGVKQAIKQKLQAHAVDNTKGIMNGAYVKYGPESDYWKKNGADAATKQEVNQLTSLMNSGRMDVDASTLVPRMTQLLLSNNGDIGNNQPLVDPASLPQPVKTALRQKTYQDLDGKNKKQLQYYLDHPGDSPFYDRAAIKDLLAGGKGGY